jgi:alkylation response protein AidB-like acyl-CoA dehydrogenase
VTVGQDVHTGGGVTPAELMGRVEAHLGDFRAAAAAGERDRAVPRESIDRMLDAGLARTLLPERFGGYELGLDSWFDAVRAIARADASHGWCASLIIHMPHYAAYLPLAGQDRMWADGVDGGYPVTGQSAFASGLMHSQWAFVPHEWTLRAAHVIEGDVPGPAPSPNPMYRLPIAAYGPLGFATAILGAVEGATEEFRDWMATRTAPDGSRVAQRPRLHRSLAELAAHVDTAELVLRRVIEAAQAPEPPAAANLGIAADVNYSHWARLALGLDREPGMAIY